MAFWREPVIEELPECLVCKVPVSSDELICSAACQDVWSWREDLHDKLSVVEIDNQGGWAHSD
jgi:hypothetical protein